MSIIAVYSNKGGVGKTSTAVNLAHLSAREGSMTLLCDMDSQGSASYYFRIRPVQGFDHCQAAQRRAALWKPVFGAQTLIVLTSWPGIFLSGTFAFAPKTGSKGRGNLGQGCLPPLGRKIGHIISRSGPGPHLGRFRRKPLLRGGGNTKPGGPGGFPPPFFPWGP